VVGGVGIQLKQKHSTEYITVLMVSSNKGWHAEWFYTTNHAPQVPSDIDAWPVSLKCWDEEPSDAKMVEVRGLLELIRKLKVAGFTGVVVMANIATRRLQSLNEIVLPAYEYTGEDYNTTRHVSELGKHDELVECICHCFVAGTTITMWVAPPVQCGVRAARG
jgi:hypothetical protein